MGRCGLGFVGFGVKFGFVNFLGDLDLNLRKFVNFGLNFECLVWGFEW